MPMPCARKWSDAPMPESSRICGVPMLPAWHSEAAAGAAEGRFEVADGTEAIAHCLVDAGQHLLGQGQDPHEHRRDDDQGGGAVLRDPREYRLGLEAAPQHQARAEADGQHGVGQRWAEDARDRDGEHERRQRQMLPVPSRRGTARD